MKRFLLAAMLTMIPSLGWAACQPSQAKPGMIGCETLATSALGTDFVQIWTPGSFPDSAKIISINNLLQSVVINLSSPPPIGNVLPNTGAFSTLTSTGGALNGTIGLATPAASLFTTLGVSGLSTQAQINQTVTKAWSGGFPNGNPATNNSYSFTGAPTGGRTDGSGTAIPLNLWFIAQDQVVWNGGPSGGGGAGGVNGFNFSYIFGGGAASGARNGLVIDMAQFGAMANVNTSYTAMQIFSGGFVNVTGAAAGSGNGRGTDFGLGINFGRGQTGIFRHEVSGMEFDFSPADGMSTDYLVFAKYVNFATNSWGNSGHAYVHESYITLGSANPDGGGPTNTSRLNVGIQFGDPQAAGNIGFPVSATGTMILSLTGTVATVMDFSAVTSTNLLRGANSFRISNAGNVYSPGMIPATGTDTGFYSGALFPILLARSVVSAVNFVTIFNSATGNIPVFSSSGTDATVSLGFKVTTGPGNFDYFNFANNVVFRIASVATTGVVSYPSFSPAVSGAILFDVGGTGAPITIGGTAATAVNIGRAAGLLGFYGATAIAKATPTGACAGNTGCQALRDALGNLGFINTGSITN